MEKGRNAKKFLHDFQPWKSSDEDLCSRWSVDFKGVRSQLGFELRDGFRIRPDVDPFEGPNQGKYPSVNLGMIVWLYNATLAIAVYGHVFYQHKNL